MYDSVNELLQLVLDHQKSNNTRLVLAASENSMSVTARLPFLTDMIHRYCFTVEADNNWSWPGSTIISKLEEEIKNSLTRLTGAQYANIKPISGLSCMTVVMSALGYNKKMVFGISTLDGGHGSTTQIARRLGLEVKYLPFDKSNFCIDLDQLRNQIDQLHSSLVYLDQGTCLFPHKVAEIRKLVGTDTVIHYDGAHVLGLILGGSYPNPLSEGADTLGGSTHKSFPGPHKGITLTNSKSLNLLIEEHSGYFVSHHHPADIAALAITLREFETFGVQYAKQVVRNAKKLAEHLYARGFNVSGSQRGFTETHQIWVDTSNYLDDPFDSSKLLLQVNIVANVVEIPYIPVKFGLRIGVQELTRYGMAENEMSELADILEAVLIRKDTRPQIQRKVIDLRQRFSKIAYSFPTNHELFSEILKAVLENG